ncbi:FAD-dependent oxidoreductase [Streptomyces sp. x-19]|uniref:FAD-dependent oxidoreductase n=1 Tax=Streptomyces sp. x-19 TaxID=2789280 RepID=UPI003980CDF8
MGAALDRLGVTVRFGVEVAKVLPDALELAGGERIAADAVLWTGGTRVAPLAAAAGLVVDERGRIVSDAALWSVSHPEVYAAGDAAAIRQGYGVMHGTRQGGMPSVKMTACQAGAAGRRASAVRRGCAARSDAYRVRTPARSRPFVISASISPRSPNLIAAGRTTAQNAHDKSGGGGQDPASCRAGTQS